MSSIDTAVGPVEHVDVGAGPAILFLHGSPGGCDQGELMTRFLTSSHRVVAPSRPGYRETPLTDATCTPAQQAELALALMDALGIDRFDVACWSGGGPSAYSLAAAHPDRVGAVVAGRAHLTAHIGKVAGVHAVQVRIRAFVPRVCNQHV